MSTAKRAGLGVNYDPLGAILSPPPAPIVDAPEAGTSVGVERGSGRQTQPLDGQPRTPTNGRAVSEDSQAPAVTVTAPRRQTAIAAPPEVRHGRHKLTTYLPRSLYEWVAGEVETAQQEGYAASIADVVRTALERLRASDPEELRRRLRGQ